MSIRTRGVVVETANNLGVRRRYRPVVSEPPVTWHLILQASESTTEIRVSEI